MIDPSIADPAITILLLDSNTIPASRRWSIRCDVSDTASDVTDSDISAIFTNLSRSRDDITDTKELSTRLLYASDTPLRTKMSFSFTCWDCCWTCSFWTVLIALSETSRCGRYLWVLWQSQIKSNVRDSDGRMHVLTVIKTQATKLQDL